MVNYSKAAYGANLNSSVNANAENGWGPYKWPAGVPASLLGTARYGDIQIICRNELVELFGLFLQLAEKHGYPIYAENPNGSGENWGPWGYDNRNISGSNTASNHSKGRACDVNAPFNPYSAMFITDLPPGLVNAWEQIGFYWGGRYSGSQDTMHFEYGYTPGDVATHVALARQLLGGSAVGAGPVKPEPIREWDEMATQAELEAVITRLIPSPEAYAKAVWAQVLNVFRPVNNPTDARAGDLLATIDLRVQSLPVDDSVAGAVWSKPLDSHHGIEKGDATRSGDLLAEIDANVQP